MLYSYYKNGSSACRCKCECGNECIRPSYDLNHHRNPPHCGCMTDYYKQIQSKKSHKDVTGIRFGSLIVDEMIYEYKKQTRVKCTCDCGNRIETFLTYLTSGNTTSCGCVHKERTSESNTKNFSGMVSDYGVVLSSRAYKNDRGVWMWNCICPCCGGSFIALPAKVLNGHISSCGCARQSSRERLINNILVDNNIEFIPQYRYIDCTDKYTLPFDFYLANFNTCIEYQGEQHYFSSEYFGGNDEFIIRQRHDKIKRDYCRNNNIQLLELPYTLSDEEIKRKILNVINP